MTTQSKVSNPIEAGPVRQFSWPLALVILALGVLLGVFASNIAAIVSKTEVASAPERISRDFPARPNLLELEKKAIIAAEINEQRALAAETARYTSLGLFYAAGNEQPALAAEIARYEGLGEFYGVEGNALAVYHQSERAFVPIVTGHDREYGLARFDIPGNETRPLAWPPRPTQFHPIENVVTPFQGNALAAYHNGEWGRPSQVIETGADGDIGLMEFFTPEE